MYQQASRDICQVVPSFKSHTTLSFSLLITLWGLPFCFHITTTGFSWSLKVINYLFVLRIPHNPKSPKSGYVCGGRNTLEGHRAAVHDVLDILETHDLFLKPEKCVWEADRVDYLGLILEKGVEIGRAHV